jgi:predicted MFS family arabinose efflux permease
MKEKILTRDFLLILSAQFVFQSVFATLLPTVPIYLARMGTKEGEIGVLVGVFTVAALIVRPFVGRALLKIPERRFLMAGAFITVLCSMGYLFAKPFFPLFVLRAVQGIAFAFFTTACFTLVASTTPAGHRGQTISFYYLGVTVALAVAPAFGVLLINHFSFSVLFLTCATLSLCSFFVTLKLRKSQGAPLETDGITRLPILTRAALPPAVMAMLSNNIWGGMCAFFPLFAVSHGVDNPGLFFMVFAAVLVLGRALGGKLLDTIDREKMIVRSLVTQFIAMIILAFSTTFPMFVLVAVIWGMANCFLYPLLGVAAIDRGGSHPGPAMGTFTALSDLGTGMGAVIMGIIVQWAGYQTMFLCMAMASLINLLYFYSFAREK